MTEREPKELAESVVELPEWDRLAVRDYYDALVTEVLGSKPPMSQWTLRHEVEVPSGEVLPLFTAAAEQTLSERPGSGEAA